MILNILKLHFYCRNQIPHLIGQLEARIFEMNKRFLHRGDVCSNYLKYFL